MIYEMKAIIVNFILSKVTVGMNVCKFVQEIIADVVLELIPENSRRSWIAMKYDGSEELAKSVTCLHLTSLFKTLSPLVIVLQQPKSEAGFFERVACDVIDLAQISKRSSSRDDSEKEAKIETFSRRWRCKVHATDGITLFSWLPNLDFFIIDPSLGKVLISSIPGLRLGLIYFKPSSKRSVLCCAPIHDIVDAFICIVVDQLLVFQMDWKTINGGALSMHRKFKYMPAAFCRTNIACIQVLLDLITILVIGETESGAVMAFEDVFGNVFA